MDLRTRYLGLELAHPIMPGSSPLADDLDTVRRLEDAGAPAIVMRSLFQEQVERDVAHTDHHIEAHTDSFAEAASFLPRPDELGRGPAEYLDQIARIKAAVAVPVIASLNGVTASGWVEHARLIEAAGADALELNGYRVVTDPDEDAAAVDGRLLALVARLRRTVELPFAVKLSPFHSSLPHLVRALGEAGARGAILFNRFYEPDLDIETLEVVPRVDPSDSRELLLRLRWLAVLSAQSRLDLAGSGGVHVVEDAVKAILAGASVVQMVSALLHHGPRHLTRIRDGLSSWLDTAGYQSLDQARSSMNLRRCPDPSALARANYMRALEKEIDS